MCLLLIHLYPRSTMLGIGKNKELSPEIGEELCQLIDRESEEDPRTDRDMYLLEKPGVESGYCFSDDGYIAPPLDMTWASKIMLYPSYLYQYHSEASGSVVACHGSVVACHGSVVACHGSVGVFPPKSLPIISGKGLPTRHSHCKGSTLDSHQLIAKCPYKLMFGGCPVK